jgi:hypothetical protein
LFTSKYNFFDVLGENYCCLGRVAYISYRLDTQPVEFEWELLDYEKIKDAILFQKILNS